jgi:hypothetical protein
MVSFVQPFRIEVSCACLISYSCLILRPSSQFCYYYKTVRPIEYQIRLVAFSILSNISNFFFHINQSNPFSTSLSGCPCFARSIRGSLPIYFLTTVYLQLYCILYAVFLLSISSRPVLGLSMLLFRWALGGAFPKDKVARS